MIGNLLEHVARMNQDLFYQSYALILFSKWVTGFSKWLADFSKRLTDFSKWLTDFSDY